MNDQNIYNPKPYSRKLTAAEIRNGCAFKHREDGTDVRVCVINEEFDQGIRFVQQFPRSVTFFGSARFPETDKHYIDAQKMAYRISKELGYAIVTGGGPGIMEAANRGAKEAGGKSVGLTIQLPKEQHTNPYLTDQNEFYYFFSRKVALSYAAEAYIYFPGGFGTLDELFEILTLVQTRKISPIPIILYGRDYWDPLDKFIRDTLLNEHEAISAEDINLYTICDSEDKVYEIVKNAPHRDDA